MGALDRKGRSRAAFLRQTGHSHPRATQRRVRRPGPRARAHAARARREVPAAGGGARRRRRRRRLLPGVLQRRHRRRRRGRRVRQAPGGVLRAVRRRRLARPRRGHQVRPRVRPAGDPRRQARRHRLDRRRLRARRVRRRRRLRRPGRRHRRRRGHGQSVSRRRLAAAARGPLRERPRRLRPHAHEQPRSFPPAGGRGGRAAAVPARRRPGARARRRARGRGRLQRRGRRRRRHGAGAAAPGARGSAQRVPPGAGLRRSGRGRGRPRGHRRRRRGRASSSTRRAPSSSRGRTPVGTIEGLRRPPPNLCAANSRTRCDRRDTKEEDSPSSAVVCGRRAARVRRSGAGRGRPRRRLAAAGVDGLPGRRVRTGGSRSASAGSRSSTRSAARLPAASRAP